jgi:hypothetical protein
MTDKLPGTFVRGGPPRVLRSPMTGTWYVVTAYRDLGEGRFMATAKRAVHEADAAGLEAAYAAHKDWQDGLLVEAAASPEREETEPTEPADLLSCCGHLAQRHLWSGGCNDCQCPRPRWGTPPEPHQHRFDVVIRDDAHMRLLGCSSTPCEETYQWDW